MYTGYNIVSCIKSYQTKLKIATNNTCTLCNLHEETIVHLFCNCSVLSQLWLDIQEWLYTKTRINLPLTNQTKILGHTKADYFFWPLNFIILITKKYIFKCSKTGNKINFCSLLKEVKKHYQEQKTLAMMNQQVYRFNKRFDRWINIFEDI